ERLVRKVGRQVVVDLHHPDARMEFSEPSHPETSGDRLSHAGVHHDDEAVDGRRRLLDQMAVAEMGRAEAPDDEARRLGHRPVWMYSTRAVFSCSSSLTRCFTTSPMLTMPRSSPSTTMGTWRIRRSVISAISESTVASGPQV